MTEEQLVATSERASRTVELLWKRALIEELDEFQAMPNLTDWPD